MPLSDATARYDGLNEGQLGDVQFEDGRTCGAGKPAALPAASEPGSGTALLVDSVRRAMERLLAAAPVVLAALARTAGFRRRLAGSSSPRAIDHGSVAGRGRGSR